MVVFCAEGLCEVRGSLLGETSWVLQKSVIGCQEKNSQS